MEKENQLVRVDSIQNKMQKQTQQGSQKSIHKNLNVMHVQKVNKTKVKESLQKSLIQNPSIYYQPKPMKIEVQIQSLLRNKPIDYLKLQRKNRNHQEKIQDKQNVLVFHDCSKSIDYYLERGKIQEKKVQKRTFRIILERYKGMEQANYLLIKSSQDKLRLFEKMVKQT